MNIKASVLFGLFAGGVLLLALGFFTGPLKKKADTKDLRVVRLSGQVIVSELHEKPLIIESEERFVGNVSISTDAIGSARVIFADNAEVSLNPNTWTEINTVSTSIIVKRGDFDVIRVASEKKWTVTRASKRYWLEDYNYNRVVEDNQDSRIQAGNKSAEAQKAQIQTSIFRQRSAFFKCYSLKLRRDPMTTQVQALVGIVVEPSGAITQAKVISLTPQDTTFENCLIQVMKRIQLPSFIGPAIETTIPFEFE